MNTEWYIKRLSWKMRMFMHTHFGWKVAKTTYNGRRILTLEETNRHLKELLLTKEPFAVARIGGSECKAMVACQPEYHDEKQKVFLHNLLVNLSGFFGSMEDFDRFSRLMESGLSEVDLMGVWFNQMEDYFLKRFGKADMTYGLLEGLEPWYSPDDPWTASLAGKRVVVIHPFAESIEKQYAKRELLFPGTEILPAFSLRTVKAVQTLLGQPDPRFATWVDALEYMYNEAMKEDFDVALIACGAYGLPLAVKLKQAGKQAIQIGGSLQLLFGIKGARWKDMPQMQRFYSDAWTSPSLKTEGLDSGVENVENGCYW